MTLQKKKKIYSDVKNHECLLVVQKLKKCLLFHNIKHSYFEINIRMF